jgi:hypothetical protein
MTFDELLTRAQERADRQQRAMLVYRVAGTEPSQYGCVPYREDLPATWILYAIVEPKQEAR